MKTIETLWFLYLKGKYYIINRTIAESIDKLDYAIKELPLAISWYLRNTPSGDKASHIITEKTRDIFVPGHCKCI